MHIKIGQQHGTNDMNGSVLTMYHNYFANIRENVWNTWTLSISVTRPYFLSIDKPVNSQNWVRLFTIDGTEGSSIKFCIKEKNSHGNGGLIATGYLTRTYPDKYQYTLFPWAGED